MSQQSNAKVRDYMQFLSGRIGEMRKALSEKHYSQGVQFMAEIVSYLPEPMKPECAKQATLVSNTIAAIRKSKVKCLSDIPDLFIRNLYKNRLLEGYCDRAFNNFVEKVNANLISMGYGRIEEEESVEKREDEGWKRTRSRLSKSR